MLSTARMFRERLEADACLIGVGAYDALSARLVQAHGFDALWISSFCASAARGFPDAGILTLTELLHMTEQLLEAAEIPAIVDCDDGYGEVAQLCRAVRSLERVGLRRFQSRTAPSPNAQAYTRYQAGCWFNRTVHSQNSDR